MDSSNCAKLAQTIYAGREVGVSLFAIWEQDLSRVDMTDNAPKNIRKINHSQHIINILEKHFATGGYHNVDLEFLITTRKIVFIYGDPIRTIEANEVKIKNFNPKTESGKDVNPGT